AAAAAAPGALWPAGAPPVPGPEPEDSNPEPAARPVLQDVVAYVEVWSSNRAENYSETFINQLVRMGAKVSKTFNKHITHVVFKEGRQSTWNKAQKAGVKLVSVLWVDKCREVGVHIDESLFPAINTNEGLSTLTEKKHKCMQPKDFVAKTPENDRRLQKKFEKMAKELDSQKAAIDGSLTYSPTTKIKNECLEMEKRIKEMKAKRENLSFTEEPVVDDLNSSFYDLPGSIKSERQKKSFRGSREVKSDAQITSSELNPGEESAAASSTDLSWVTPKRAKEQRTKGKEGVQHTLVVELHNVERGRSEGISKGTLVDRDPLGPSVATPKSHPFRRAKGPIPKNLTNKMNHCSAHLNASTSSDELDAEERSRGKWPSMNLTAAILHQGAPEVPSQSKSKSRSETSNSEDASYDDYFSPANLNERTALISRVFASGLQQTSPSPPHLSQRVSLFKGKRKSLLGKADATPVCKKKTRSVQGSDGPAEECNAELHQPGKWKGILVAKPTSERGIPTAVETPQCSSTSDPEKIKSETDSGTRSKNSCLHPGELMFRSGSLDGGPDAFPTVERCIAGNPHPVEKASVFAETKEKEENTNSETLSTRRGETPTATVTEEHELSFKDGSDVEESTEEKESLSRTCVQILGVKNGKERRDGDGVQENFEDQRIKPHWKSKKTEKVKKPTRTLVMTSMPSEKQNVILQVVKTLKGFSCLHTVCETTTHVVVGAPRRTLNVLLGIARGCWIVSYEWVLWSLEFGCWISEEPYELSNDFPAAPICRLERHLAGGDYHQSLFSSHPVMYITTTSDPPWHKLVELVELCGGRVTKILRQASLCIGSYKGKKQPQIKYLSEKWILGLTEGHHFSVQLVKGRLYQARASEEKSGGEKMILTVMMMGKFSGTAKEIKLQLI
ncbi:microcephalin, partial [Tachyglossus aculeatus]|uniref:microcephalin n=1 Tax=Tachyglossus aculeatus TaxID=9261 RepID=UPI0018F76747